MNIQVRWNGTYADVKFIAGSTMLDCGLLDAAEREELAAALGEAISELMKDRPAESEESAP